jgi:hypothetical protein
VGEPDRDEDADGEREADSELVAVPDLVLLDEPDGVLLRVPERLRDGEEDTVQDVVEEKVLEGEKLPLRVPEKDSEAVCDGERDMDVEADDDGDRLTVDDELREGVAVPEKDGVKLRVVLSVHVGEKEGLRLSLRLLDFVLENVRECVTELEVDFVLLSDGLAEAVKVELAVGLKLSERLPEKLRLGVKDCVEDAE